MAAIGEGDVAHHGWSRRDGGGDEQGGWWVVGGKKRVAVFGCQIEIIRTNK
jgi:hypothetical protein